MAEKQHANSVVSKQTCLKMQKPMSEMKQQCKERFFTDNKFVKVKKSQNRSKKAFLEGNLRRKKMRKKSKFF